MPKARSHVAHGNTRVARTAGWYQCHRRRYPALRVRAVTGCAGPPGRQPSTPSRDRPTLRATRRAPMRLAEATQAGARSPALRGCSEREGPRLRRRTRHRCPPRHWAPRPRRWNVQSWRCALRHPAGCVHPMCHMELPARRSAHLRAVATPGHTATWQSRARGRMRTSARGRRGRASRGTGRPHDGMSHASTPGHD